MFLNVGLGVWEYSEKPTPPYYYWGGSGETRVKSSKQHILCCFSPLCSTRYLMNDEMFGIFGLQRPCTTTVRRRIQLHCHIAKINALGRTNANFSLLRVAKPYRLGEG